MKLLFYSPVMLSSGGGCERWHCDITASLKNKFGFDVQIVTANLGAIHWSDEYLSSQLSVPYHKINFAIFHGAILPGPKPFFELLKYFRRADAIHVIQGFIGQDLLLLVLKWLTGKKIIIGHHAPILHANKIHNFYISHISRYLFNFFDGHMTLNASDKEFLEKKWKVRNVVFIPSGIQVNRFIDIKRPPHKTLNFLTVGSYRTSQKGIDLALSAISEFNHQLPKNRALFNFVGGGLTNQTLPGNVHELGYIPYEQMPDIYANSDIYLLSSREEPFGLVLIEAWSSGLPVLATPTEGPRDMLVVNQNGWFTKDISSSAITTGLLNTYNLWLKSSKLFESMASYCRSTGNSYSIDVTANRMRKSFFQ